MCIWIGDKKCLHRCNNVAKCLEHHRNHQSRSSGYAGTLRLRWIYELLSLIQSQDVVDRLMNSQFRFYHYFLFLIIILKLAYTNQANKPNQTNLIWYFTSKITKKTTNFFYSKKIIYPNEVFRRQQFPMLMMIAMKNALRFCKNGFITAIR